MERYISALLGSVLLIAIGIVGVFLVLPAFSEPDSRWLGLLQLILLLVSIFLAIFYSYMVIGPRRGKRGR